MIVLVFPSQTLGFLAAATYYKPYFVENFLVIFSSLHASVGTFFLLLRPTCPFTPSSRTFFFAQPWSGVLYTPSDESDSRGRTLERHHTLGNLGTRDPSQEISWAKIFQTTNQPTPPIRSLWSIRPDSPWTFRNSEKAIYPVLYYHRIVRSI